MPTIAIDEGCKEWPISLSQNVSSNDSIALHQAPPPLVCQASPNLNPPYLRPVNSRRFLLVPNRGRPVPGRLHVHVGTLRSHKHGIYRPRGNPRHWNNDRAFMAHVSKDYKLIRHRNRWVSQGITFTSSLCSSHQPFRRSFTPAAGVFSTTRT